MSLQVKANVLERQILRAIWKSEPIRKLTRRANIQKRNGQLDRARRSFALAAKLYQESLHG